ncbi:ABC transporter ATP-binding protein [Pararhizobium haloflavum]|uniref:ABC transporter ATP-binding protein n=1 Tax=Pararhizobium haloflavum TaxID=2037914 RepID=UPI0012FFF20E|nr:ABC transporter ATP-binding protein [Pararhizobium haloflavum]
MQPAIRFDRIGLDLGGVAIYDDISFAVEKGEFVCLLGPSGCGKSTALRLMGDLLPLQRGTIEISGLPPERSWDQIAFIFQQPRLLPWRDALSNAAFGLELRHPSMPKNEREDRARRQMERVGLGRDLHKMPVMLSGGEKQRVSIARALALDPDIILMDEPFSALDPNTRVRLRDQILELWTGSGKTVVFVTHDMDEALYLADRIVVFSNKPGRIQAVLGVDHPRPREVLVDRALLARRNELIALFDELGEAKI